MWGLRQCVAVAWFAVACGGTSPGAESPEAETEAASGAGSDTESASAGSEREPSSGASSAADERAGDSANESKTNAASSGGEPEFTDSMSVDQAVKAVPPGAERANLDPDTLAEPLRKPELYEPCKPGSARVKLRVAVWHGKAVGVDVTTTPKNEKLAACIQQQVRGITWQKQVKSLNTVEYQF